MEGVIQTRGPGLLSPPSNPQTRAFRPLQSLRNRSFLNKNLTIQSGFSSISSQPLKNPSKISPLFSFPPKSHLFPSPDKNYQVCRSSAAISADGEGFVEKKETPKLFGVEILTLKKIIPLGLMFFCILFNYTILRDTKDVLVVTAKGSSAEIIPFLKTWVNLPMAVGFMLLYTKLSNVLSKEALFYSVIFPFIAFFGAFGFVLYPLSAKIHPTAFADKLLAALGPSFLGPVAILRIWSFCLFYVMAELWGSVVISVLFWGFANQVKAFVYYCLNFINYWFLDYFALLFMIGEIIFLIS